MYVVGWYTIHVLPRLDATVAKRSKMTHATVYETEGKKTKGLFRKEINNTMLFYTVYLLYIPYSFVRKNLIIILLLLFITIVNYIRERI